MRSIPVCLACTVCGLLLVIPVWSQERFVPVDRSESPIGFAENNERDSDSLLHLLERLEQLEAEVAALRAESPSSVVGVPAVSGIKPSSAELLPPSPAPGATPVPMPSVPPAKKYPTVEVHGVFQADAIYFTQDPENRLQLGDIQDGAGFRRTRLSANGAVAENVNYFIQMDFGFFGRPTFTDVWGEATHLPWLGNVRAGQWKQPFSLEVPTSFRYQTFLERSLLFQTFEPFRHIGVGFYNNSEDEMWTWAVSAFRMGQDQFGNDIGDAGGWSTAGRLTHLWWYEQADDATQRLDYLHTGVSFWVGDPASNTFQYRTIPEAFVGAFGVPAGTLPGTSQQQIGSISNGTPPFVDTGVIPANTIAHVGTEALWAAGPFSWQSEIQMANLSQIGGPQLHFWGFYTQWMYFLTGESKPFLRKLGQIDRIQPLHPFLADGNCVRGPGAWEIAFRVSHVDLDDENIHGGRLTDMTAGMNWYLNAYTKVQFNYIRAMLNRRTATYAGPSAADVYGVRLQVDF